MRMKRWGCALLAGVLSLLLCWAPAEEQTAMRRVRNDWMTMLVRQENRLAQEGHTLELIQRFAAGPTWENLVQARTAAYCMVELLDYYASASWELAATPQDYLELIGQGMDIADVQSTLEGYCTYLPGQIEAYDLPTWREYAYMLMFGVYDQSTLEDMQGSVARRMDSVESDLREWFLTTNYLILEIPKGDAQELMDLANENAPTIMASYDQPFETANAILNEYNALVLESEERVLEAREALTRSEAMLEQPPALTAQPIEGLPEVRLPGPTALNAQACEYAYYWKDEDGALEAPTLRMEIRELPNCFILTLHDMTLEDYQAYALEVIDAWLEPDAMSDTAVSFTLADGILLLIAWDGEAQSLCVSVSGGQVCLAPGWYLAAL